MPNTLKLYGYSRCSTCRKAKRWLEEKGMTFESQDLVEKTPSSSELKELVQNSGKELRKFFNTSGQKYRELGLKERLPLMAEGEMLDLLASDGMLIKRPIATDGKRTVVGFKEAEWAGLIGGSVLED